MKILISFVILLLMQNKNELEEKIAQCPDTPNCVNSVYSDDKDHFLPAFDVSEDPKRNWEKLINLLKNDRYVKIVHQDDHFIKSEYKIPVFGFIDDVLFYLDKNSKRIHFRSASRVGYSDLGVNKNRIQKIRKKLKSTTVK